MKIVTSALNALAVAFAYFCVGTTAVQVALLGLLLCSGTLTGAKILRYTAAIYGLDLSRLPMSDDSKDPDKTNDLKTREEVIESRVQRSELLDQRRQAIELGIGAVRDVQARLRVDSTRFEERKEQFDVRLQKDEEQARQAAIQEVQRILAAMRPKQAKTLIMRMLDEQDLDPADIVMRDIVTVLNDMPPERTKKILGEFKTEEERDRVNEIFRAIGQLDSIP